MEVLIRKEIKEGVHYNKEIERAVLGICFLEKAPLPHTIRQLKAEMFFDKGHQVVFHTLKEMFDKRLDIDLLTATQYLWSKKVSEIGGHNTAYFLTRLTNHVVSSAHHSYHCAIIQDLYLQRSAYLSDTALHHKAKRWKFPPHARWYLSMITKEALRLTAPRYGRDLIKPAHKVPVVEVPNADWVYLLHLIKPGNGYTCIPGRTPYKWSREECLKLIPVNKKLYVEDGSALVWR